MRTKIVTSLAVSLLTLLQSTAFAQNYSETEMHELAQLMSQDSVAESLLVEETFQKKLIDKKASTPTVQRFLAWMKQYRALKLSQDEKLATEPLPGAVTSFFVSYPFTGTSMFDFARPLTPENGYDTSKVPEGLQPPAMNWMSYQSVGNLSAVAPKERMYFSGSSTVFLATRIHIDSKTPIKAWIEIPSTSPVVAWMNGKRVVEFIENGPANAPIFGEKWPVVLQPGDNILTIKTAQLENEPEFFVFLTNQKTNEPLSFQIDLNTPIVSGALENNKPETSVPSILETISKDDALSPSLRAFVAQTYLPQNEDVSRINDLLMTDIDATASLPEDELELAILLLEPSKSLQILKKAMPRFKGNARFELLYARQMIMLAQNQGDAVTRFIDEWPEIKKVLDNIETPTINGFSYEPLRLQLLALAELTVMQPLTAHKDLVSSIQSDANNEQMLSTFPHGTLSDAKQLKEYQASLESLLSHDQNASTLITELLDQKLRKAAVSAGNYDALATVLASIQKETDRFLKIHPNDNIYWDFWLSVLSNYGIETPTVLNNAPLKAALDNAGFTADAETWFIYYISMRSNDPYRWLKYAEHCLHTNRIPDAINAYEMASLLQPEDETITERIKTLSKLNSYGQQEKVTADADSAFEAPYIIHDIPANNDENASELVSLLDNRVVRVLPNGLTSTYYQLAFEVLDEKGLKSLRSMPLQYSPSDEKIEILSVTTTKKDGSVRRLYKTNEFDMADESIKMYYDQRALLIEIQDLAVGDRVEYQFKRTQIQRESSSVFFYSDIFQLQNAISRRWMKYTVLAPESMNVHMMRHNPSGSPQTVGDTKTENGISITTYEEKNAPRFLSEKMQPGSTELMPYLLISTFNSWQELANWYIDLSAQQWKADDAIRAKVRELTNGITDPFEKLKRIHSFLVKNTRYVALEFGIHGHKPYPAAQIFERRFGDCKDKASLLKVMLKEAGIDSDFVIARTRMNGDITMELPSPYLFDHAILYVPEFDLFLDGTAEFSGTKELPAMDQDGWAFIISDDTSYMLRKIPVASAKENVSEYTWKFDLTKDGTIPYEYSAFLHGFNAPNYREQYQSESMQRETLEQTVASSIPGSKLETFEFSDLADLEKDVTLKLTANTSFGDIAKVNKNTWLIYPQIVESNMVSALTSGAKRKTPIIRPVQSTLRKSISLILPEDAHITLPASITETTSFGSYSISARKEGNTVTTDSELIIERVKIQPDEYPDYIDFLQRFDRRLNTQYQITIDN